MTTEPTREEALLACPFCGGEAEADEGRPYRNISTGAHGTGIAVYCRDCPLEIMICRGDVPDIELEQVVELWNRRASPPSQSVSEQALRTALIECGRAAGCILADEVSNDFLMLVPAEVKARLAIERALQSAPPAVGREPTEAMVGDADERETDGPTDVLGVEIRWFPAEAHRLYRIGKGDDGQHYATRQLSPMFCFSGPHCEDVEEMAGKAIEAYMRGVPLVSPPIPAEVEGLAEIIADAQRMIERGTGTIDAGQMHDFVRAVAALNKEPDHGRG